MSEASNSTSEAPAIIADQLSLSGTEGLVYRPTTFEIPATGMSAIVGRTGSGRTALAITLAGRMVPGNGYLNVLGHEVYGSEEDEQSSRERRKALKNIRTQAAIAGVEQIDLLDRDLRLKAILTEHRAWSAPWFSWQPAADEEYFEEIARPVFGDDELPPLDAYVSEIRGVEKHMLRIALALRPVHNTEVKLLVVDDIEQVHELNDRMLLLERFAEIAQSIPVVLTAANPVPEEFIAKERQIDLRNDKNAMTDEEA